MSGLSKYDFRNRENKSQSVKPNFLFLKLISSDDYAIANSRAFTRVKNLSSDEYKDANVVKHGYGNDRVVGEVVKIGPVSILKDFLNKNGLALPSDKENSKSSKYILDQINLNTKICKFCFYTLRLQTRLGFAKSKTAVPKAFKRYS